MKTLSLNVPDFFELNEKEAKLILASKLYEKGQLSLGESAELSGVSKRTFIELLGHYDVSVFNYDAESLESDIDNA